MASTDLSFGSIPAFYREVYEKICSPTNGNVKLEVFRSLLVKSQLNGSVVSQAPYRERSFIVFDSTPVDDNMDAPS